MTTFKVNQIVKLGGSDFLITKTTVGFLPDKQLIHVVRVIQHPEGAGGFNAGWIYAEALDPEVVRIMRIDYTDTDGKKSTAEFTCYVDFEDFIQHFLIARKLSFNVTYIK